MTFSIGFVKHSCGFFPKHRFCIKLYLLEVIFFIPHSLIHKHSSSQSLTPNIYTHSHTRTQTQIHTRSYTHTSSNLHTNTHTNSQIHTHSDSITHTHIHSHIQTYTYILIHIHKHIQTFFIKVIFVFHGHVYISRLILNGTPVRKYDSL